MYKRFDQVAPSVYHFNFAEQAELGSSFVRFQEHYENPEFKGKVFTLEEFAKWYTAYSREGKKSGKYTYNSDVLGFNVPSSSLDPFFNGAFNPLRPEEVSILSAVQYLDKPFYLIGTFGKANQSILNHEIAHGLLATNEEYRAEALGIVQNAHPKLVGSIHHFLSSRCYHPDVYDDEVHAYGGESVETLKRKGISTRHLEPTGSKLRALFKAHTGKER